MQGSNQLTVQKLLATLKPIESGYHAIADYMIAMADYPCQATSILHVGRDAVVIGLSNCNVLKITSRDVPADFGTRPFDVPIVRRGSKKVEAVTINYFEQTLCAPCTNEQYLEFLKDLARQNYWMSDPGVRNVGYFETSKLVLLVDPWSVEKIE